MADNLQRTAGRRLVALVASAGVLLAACSGAASPSPAPTAAASVAGVTSSAAPAGSQAPAGSGSVQLAVAQDAKLGAHLTGANGMALYLLTKDAASKSNCTGGCAKAWPPFEVAAGQTPTAGSGVTGTIATITRSDDGKAQVTYNGIPLYYFSGDKSATDVNGQGFNGVWFLAGPDSTAASGTIMGGVGQSGGAGASGGASPAMSAAPASAGSSVSSKY